MTITERAKRRLARMVLPPVLFWESLSPGTRTLLKWVVTVLTLVSVLCWLNGCRATTPAHLAVPTAAAVQAQIGAPAQAARASNARAVQLAAQAEKTGLAAGSADARTLSLATAETDRHLVEVLAGRDALTARLGTVQLQIDTLEKNLAAVTRQVTVEKTRGDKEEVLHHRWRDYAVGGCLLADVLISIAGAWLQARFRQAEAFAAHEVTAFGRALANWIMHIPAVAGVVLKIAAGLAVLL